MFVPCAYCLYFQEQLIEYQTIKQTIKGKAKKSSFSLVLPGLISSKSSSIK